MKKKETVQKRVFLQNGFNPIPREFFDPLGSYTGRAADPAEQPIQDADDL